MITNLFEPLSSQGNRPGGTGRTGPALPHELAARQAAATPDAVAVIDGTRTVTYAELDARANQLARYLRDLGVGPETLVGVCLQRGADLVLALLAVWRCGAAYVPLDPAHPPGRRAWILADTRAPVLLTHSSLADAGYHGRAVFLDLDGFRLDDYPGTDPGVDVDPATVAYAIYTSGSTGTPKGVLITHEAIANRIAWTVREHGLGPADRVIQKTSVSFDAAGWEFFAPLTCGASVVLAPVGAERDLGALVRAISEHKVTVLQGVPSVLRLLVEEPGWRTCVTLRLIFSAGEPLHAELCQQLTAGLGAQVWNTYGPTECAIDVTAQQVSPFLVTGPVPIGRPIDRTRVLVLDDEGEPVPVGVVGDLYVSGIGLARGYLNRPDLTAERFVPDPYGPAGSRLYVTGDQVRWRHDRTLDYVGRTDNQVKVNGVRIEPGEIESALLLHPEVLAAVVAGFSDAAGERRLVAYVRGSRPLTPTQLRGFLVDRLPETHVPAVFHQVEAFPLTASGKVDRNSLPAVDFTLAPAYEAPRTPAERVVAEAWQELLGVDQVGVHDDFFQLGGTSLGLTRLANRLNARTAGKISMRGLFTASTVAAQAALLAEQAMADPAAIVPVPRTGNLPLSFGQHRLWFLDQMHPGSPEWVSPVFLRLPATVTQSVVARALAAVEARHEALRTRYLTEGAEPYQQIGSPGQVELRLVHSTGADLAELFAEQFARGFDLSRGPLWRAMLVALPADEHVLLLTVHHIASDGWTTVVLEREIRELCAAYTDGREPRLPVLSVQYADYAAWQRAQLTDDVVATELGYWRAKLADLPQLTLPLDRPRPTRRDPSGSGVRISLPAPLAAAVADLGRTNGATPYMTLLAGFATLLARYSGQWDVPIGTPVAGRDRPEITDVVGFFLNSLVVRCDLRPEFTFAQAVRRVREVASEAFAHQQLPFERLVDELAAERDLSRTPLYQVAFDLQDEGATSVVTADATAMEAFQRAWGVAKTDLTLFMWRGVDGRLDGAFEFATSIFDDATVQRMAEHFARLLQAAVDSPSTRLDRLDLLTPDEQAWLVKDCNSTAVRRDEFSVLDLFEAQAAATPGAPAVRCGENVVSYAELDSRANQIAHQLHASGIGPEDTVGVLLDRGPKLMASLLAVWKTGAAYVPVDPSYPAERVGSMLEDAGAQLAITSSAYKERFNVATLLVDTHALLIAASPCARLARVADPDRLAYVIFTSGSTGRPKGVQITHRGLANHVRWAADELASQGTGGAPLFSSVAFDLVVPNLWAPLVTGQPVVVIDPKVDLAKLGAAIADAGPFSFIKLTPGHLELLSHQLDRAQVQNLASVIVVAGEALSGELANAWYEMLGPGRLINEYGPTEASVGTCTYPITQRQGVDVVPIGRPLPNLTVHVLDEALRPVPTGVVGELYVGGAGVARGYAGRPDLTADRFGPDPWGPPGARLYRTGDLARRRRDGAVDFLGRVDDQAKVNGYRIEPGEVQSVLASHPGVHSACVLVRDQRLVAYYVGEADDLTEYCALRLPEFMIPDWIVAVPRIPLNANGKVDRAALPDPRTATAGETAVTPRTVVEERIAEIWDEVLGRRVGVFDSFFKEGGHSILAVRLIARMHEEFELQLPIRLIFERPTIAGLAEAVEEQIRAEIDALSDAELSNESMPSREHQA